MTKTIDTIKTANTRSEMLYSFSENADLYLKNVSKKEIISDVAFNTIKRVKDISEKITVAQSVGRIKGMILLTKLYISDMRYRRIGYKNFITQLIGITLFNKKNKNLP